MKDVKKVVDSILGIKVGKVRATPIVIKIVILFTIFLLITSFSTNYINLMLNRRVQVKLMNQLLVKDLKEIFIFASNQHEIYTFTKDYDKAVANIQANASRQLLGEKSLALGVHPKGKTFFSILPAESSDQDYSQGPELRDSDLTVLQEKLNAGVYEGSLTFRTEDGRYLGVFKYIEDWDYFLIRAEDLGEFYQPSRIIFRNISLLIIGISLLVVLLGIWIISYNLRFVEILTQDIMAMQKSQKLQTIDLSQAPSDDITYLGMAFNSLVMMVDNLMGIFKRFVTADVAQKAYKEHQIRLEGAQEELTILFTDIRGFTYMTETLGADIINLLNMHYDRAISHIHEHQGTIGSIIGDALLAVYGTLPPQGENKSTAAIRSAFQVQSVARELREEMHHRREKIMKQRGSLTEAEEKIYKAVLIEVGVGIDRGQVFYGNIGSYQRMTNTVIGDNVNAASRLEGLTRLYKVPVIISREVMEEIRQDTDEYHFLELDRVQVKGKTIGRPIFWPIPYKEIDEALQRDIDNFSSGLKLYYQGEWKHAAGNFTACTLPCARVFAERTKGGKAPLGWNGIWTMTTK